MAAESNPLSTGAPPYLPALDGVRAVAVLMVVVYHATHVASPVGWFAQAFAVVRGMLWVGVDLFFVLSGFLITRILISTRGSPRCFRSFYARRTLRIFPLYYGLLLALFVVLPACAHAVGGIAASIVESDDYMQLWANQLWLWTYTQNFLQASGPSRLPGFGHFWSLAIEEQFYLVWPALVGLVGRGERGARRVAALCVALVAAAPIARATLLGQGAEPWAVFHWTFTRCDALAWGALAAAALADEKVAERARRVAAPLLVAAVAAWLACGAVAGGWSKVAYAIQTAGMTIVAAGFTAWVIAVAKPDAQGWLTAPWLRAIGKYSYAMYVFHWPLCRLVERLLKRTSLPTVAAELVQVVAVVATSFALAWLSWHAWEKHWLRLKRHAPY